MSWSVHVTAATPHEAIRKVDVQLAHSLARPENGGLSDDGERETCHRVRETIAQILRTHDPELGVAIQAYGHISYRDYATKSGPVQYVSFDIKQWVGKVVNTNLIPVDEPGIPVEGNL